MFHLIQLHSYCEDDLFLRRLKTIRLGSLACLLPFFLFCFSGCNQTKAAKTLLEEMSTAYREAGGYEDQGRVVVRSIRGDASDETTLPFRVVFQRPDRLRIECYQTMAVSDGTTFFAAVGHVPGQVLVEDIEKPFGLEQLFRDDQLRSGLSEGLAGCPVQLPLLLADNTVEIILSSAISQPIIAGTEEIHSRPCSRIEIKTAEGLLLLWIDKEEKILRRMKVPSDHYSKSLSEQSGVPTGTTVTVDFLDAKFTPSISPNAFAYEIPKDASRVTRLELTPAPHPPSPLVGQRVPPFVLRGIDGETVSNDSIKGSIAVLEFFFSTNVSSQRSMPEITRAIHEIDSSADVPLLHYAVSIDSTEVTDPQLVKCLSTWGAGGTLLRDPRGVAMASFELPSCPAVVVTAPDGTVADVAIGTHNRMTEDLRQSIQALHAGQATRALVEKRFETRLREHEQVLEKIADTGRIEVLPEQVISPKRQPVRFKVEQAWKSDTIRMPGNIVCLPAETGGAPRIITLDGWGTVVELDTAGKEVARHELGLPNTASIGFLRSAVDASGKRWWLCSSSGAQQLFVFDDLWTLHTTYPDSESPTHAGISDAFLMDSDGDGSLEMIVGYFGSVGVQGVTLAGERLWSQRALEGVQHIMLDIPVEGSSRGVICSNGRGQLIRLGPSGEILKTPAVVSQNIRSLSSGLLATDAWAMVGMEHTNIGVNVIVGIGSDLQSVWKHPLPDGVHRDGPIEPITWADLFGTPRRQWIIAAPDGSVHLLWADGRIIDHYQHGAALVGIGGYRFQESGYLLVATRNSFESLRIIDVGLD